MAAYVREDVGAAEVIHVFGEIDLANAQELESYLNGVSKTGGALVLDLTGCTYMDSSGLRVLAIAHKRRDGRLRVVAPSGGPIRRILDITGLSGALGASNTVPDALA